MFDWTEGLDPTQRVSLYDAKQSDGKVPVMLELWRMLSTSSLPSFSGSLWPRVLAPDRLLSNLNCVIRLHRIVWNMTILRFKLHTYAKLNCLKRNCFDIKCQNSYISISIFQLSKQFISELFWQLLSKQLYFKLFSIIKHLFKQFSLV